VPWSSNSYAAEQAALLVHGAQHVLSWDDLIYAIDLNGMNSSITALFAPVQANRPFKWPNWHAARMLPMLKGGICSRTIPTGSSRTRKACASIRQASASQAWAQLRRDLLIQINSSDHHPAVRVGTAPSDSWELDTPQMRQFYVKGGPLSYGQHGFILSDANWDPYPLANEIEAFTIALANMDVAVAQRLNRFTSTFFSGLPQEEYDPGEPGRFGTSQVVDWTLRP
jgi:histidine ammonia-lyase